MKQKIRWTMLLSHHTPEQYCRTYIFFGRRVCARCFGIPIGIVLGLCFKLTIPFWILFILPIPTFLNFLFQELGIIKSRNILKTILTIPLGILLLEIIYLLGSRNFLIGLGLILYIILIEFIVAIIMSKKGKLEPFMKMYEDGIYTK